MWRWRRWQCWASGWDRSRSQSTTPCQTVARHDAATLSKHGVAEALCVCGQRSPRGACGGCLLSMYIPLGDGEDQGCPMSDSRTALGGQVDARGKSRAGRCDGRVGLENWREGIYGCFWQASSLARAAGGVGSRSVRKSDLGRRGANKQASAGAAAVNKKWSSPARRLAAWGSPRDAPCPDRMAPMGTAQESGQCVQRVGCVRVAQVLFSTQAQPVTRQDCMLGFIPCPPS